MAYPTAPPANHIEEAKREFLVEKVEAEDGTIYTRLRNANVMRTWKLEYLQLSEADQTTMNSWHAGVKGSYQSDTWANPYLTGTVKIRCTAWAWKMGAYPRRDLDVTLEETP